MSRKRFAPYYIDLKGNREMYMKITPIYPNGKLQIAPSIFLDKKNNFKNFGVDLAPLLTSQVCSFVLGYNRSSATAWRTASCLSDGKLCIAHICIANDTVQLLPGEQQVAYLMENCASLISALPMTQFSYCLENSKLPILWQTVHRSYLHCLRHSSATAWRTASCLSDGELCIAHMCLEKKSFLISNSAQDL
ncbi:hypothetical protein ACJJTC_014485 [Scirpophaga incertulas]